MRRHTKNVLAEAEQYLRTLPACELPLFIEIGRSRMKEETDPEIKKGFEALIQIAEKMIEDRKGEIS